MAYEYGRPLRRMKLNGKELLIGENSRPDDSWEPSLPQDTATLWRYMSFAKFFSLLVVSQLWNRKGRGGEVWFEHPGF